MKTVSKEIDGLMRRWPNADRKVIENLVAHEFKMTIHEASKAVTSYFNEIFGYAPPRAYPDDKFI